MITREWKRHPVAMIVDGVVHATEQEWISYNDWRNTPLGLINFGYVRLGATRKVPPYAK